MLSPAFIISPLPERSAAISRHHPVIKPLISTFTAHITVIQACPLSRRLDKCPHGLPERQTSTKSKAGGCGKCPQPHPFPTAIFSMDPGQISAGCFLKTRLFCLIQTREVTSSLHLAEQMGKLDACPRPFMLEAAQQGPELCGKAHVLLAEGPWCNLWHLQVGLGERKKKNSCVKP